MRLEHVIGMILINKLLKERNNELEYKKIEYKFFGFYYFCLSTIIIIIALGMSYIVMIEIEKYTKYINFQKDNVYINIGDLYNIFIFLLFIFIFFIIINKIILPIIEKFFNDFYIYYICYTIIGLYPDIGLSVEEIYKFYDIDNFDNKLNLLYSKILLFSVIMLCILIPQISKNCYKITYNGIYDNSIISQKQTFIKIEEIEYIKFYITSKRCNPEIKLITKNKNNYYISFRNIDEINYENLEKFLYKLKKQKINFDNQWLSLNEQNFCNKNLYFTIIDKYKNILK